MAPENRGCPKRKGLSSNHPISGAMLVSGRVVSKIHILIDIYIYILLLEFFTPKNLGAFIMTNLMTGAIFFKWEALKATK